MFGDSAAQRYKQRSILVNGPDEKSPHFIQVCEFNLPDCLTSEYFLRHELTLKDYETILKCIRQFPLLQLLALSKNIPLADRSFLSIAFVRVQTCSVTGSNHHHLIEQLMQKKRRELKEDYKEQQDRLICPYDAHMPPLPVHFVTHEELKQFPPPGRFYQQTWKWKDIEIVPREYYHGYLVMVKVIPREEYESMYGVCRSRTQLPCEFLIQGQVFYDTEEAFCFQTRENHLELIQLPESSLAMLKALEVES